MYSFRKSIMINQSPHDVFDYVTKPANFSRWQNGTESAFWTSDGVPDVGSTFKVVARFMGRKIETNVEITGWDPPNLQCIEFATGPLLTNGAS
jgi:uncharacterized protein YndB with AHSA1/START domain